MLKLNRTTEYGLIALKHMGNLASADGEKLVTSAREVSETYGLPFEITAKTLQRLKDNGLIVPVHGAREGYVLSRPLSEITFSEFIQKMEGPQAVVDCCDSSEQSGRSGACSLGGKCGIQPTMSVINQKMHEVLNTVRLSDLEMPSR
jgi:Rrf2 family protein